MTVILLYTPPPRCCLDLIVVVGFECSSDPESYAGGSVATGRVTNAGQVKERSQMKRDILVFQVRGWA
jgi:hypothetical protein